MATVKKGVVSDTTITGKGRKPDYKLKALNTATEERTHELGSAWINSDGSIYLQISRFVQLPTDPTWTYRLFPNNN